MKQPLSIETSRLNIRWLGPDDASFVLRLVNDPDWLEFIGDKQVHDLEEARNYLDRGPMQMYRRHGFGLNRVALKFEDTPIGICGILKRDELEDADLGYALLPEYRGEGYVHEAATAVLQHARSEMAIKRVVAIVTANNTASQNVLLKLGFEQASDWQSESELLELFVLDI